MGLLKRFVVGEPLATSEEQHQRLGRPTALAVFASDAISSTAYATEEILLVLVPLAGLAALTDLLPISVIVIVLLTIVITSYRQTIYAYPSGGGSYVVLTREPRRDPVARRRRVAARRLHPHRRGVDLGRRRRHHVCVPRAAARACAAVPRLRRADDVRQPARAEGVGPPVRRPDLPVHDHDHRPRSASASSATSPEASRRSRRTPRSSNELTDNGVLLTGITAMAFLRAFSSGAVALTGIEAISNGVPAFKKPESHNAATTLIVMGVILGSFFLGIVGARRTSSSRR